LAGHANRLVSNRLIPVLQILHMMFGLSSCHGPRSKLKHCHCWIYQISVNGDGKAETVRGAMSFESHLVCWPRKTRRGSRLMWSSAAAAVVASVVVLAPWQWTRRRQHLLLLESCHDPHGDKHSQPRQLKGPTSRSSAKRRRVTCRRTSVSSFSENRLVDFVDSTYTSCYSPHCSCRLSQARKMLRCSGQSPKPWGQ
jgi:hypothetical protein